MLRSMPTYGELLNTLRTGRGWSQTELARRAGVAQSLISQIEKTGATPRLDTWAALMGAFDLTFDYMPRPKTSPARQQLADATALLDEATVERLARLADVVAHVPDVMLEGLILMAQKRHDETTKRQAVG